jgi:hypothetical protein
MTYAQYGLISATDFNNFVGATNSTTANTLNAVLGVGSGNSGYGQPTVANVAQYATVSATDWAALINKMTSMANQQGTSITALTAPTSGDRINYLSALSTNLSSIYTRRNFAAAQGSSTPTATTNATAWSSAVTFTHTVSFASADAVRYFFNAGGQIAITLEHPTGTGINSMFNSMATAAGTIVISSPSSGSVTIAGTSYSGVSKIGGSGTASTVNSNVGYYALTTSNQEIFKQAASSAPTGYTSSYISVNVRTNGTQGVNGDKGTVLTITTLWDEVPNGLLVSSGTKTTVTVRYPSISYLSNSWGTVSVTGTVTGS